MAKTLCLTGFWVFVAASLVGSAQADLQADQKACTAKLTSLTNCFAYVQGNQKNPSTDCCTNLKNVYGSAPKCLCILVKDSTSPSLGVSINQTLALGLPAACKVNANISECPALLNISPDSPDAKVFEAANKTSPAPHSSDGSSGSSSTAATTDSSNSMSLSLKPKLSLSALAVLLPLGFLVFSKLGVDLRLSRY